MNPLRRFLDYGAEGRRILHLSMRGISYLRTVPRTMEVLAEADNTELPPEFEEAKSDAEFVENEIKRGFPLLNAHTLVSSWGSLEVMIEDLQVAFLLNDPMTLQHEKFAKTRIPLALFESVEKDERMRLIVSEFDRNELTGRRHGVDKCEAALETLGLSGPVTSEIRQGLCEIHHVRNVLVHRGGVADRRIVSGCPWLGLKLGDQVTVSHEMQHQCDHVLVDYVMKIMCRIAVRFGATLTRDEHGKWLWSD